MAPSTRHPFNDPIRPSPTVRVELAAPPAPLGASDGSGVHDAHHFGWIAEDDAAFLPPERRPLTLRGIRSWTIGSVVGWMVILGLTLVTAVSRNQAREAHGANTAARIEAIPAHSPAPAEAPPPKTGVPLESLPRADAVTGQRVTAKAQTAAPTKTTAHAKPAATKRKTRELKPGGI